MNEGIALEGPKGPTALRCKPWFQTHKLFFGFVDTKTCEKHLVLGTFGYDDIESTRKVVWRLGSTYMTKTLIC